MSVVILMKPYLAHPFKLFVLYLGKAYAIARRKPDQILIDAGIDLK